MTTVYGYRTNEFCYWFVGAFAWSLLAYFQTFGVSLDFDNYKQYFSLTRSLGVESLYLYRFEPGFALLATFLASLSSDDNLVYAAIVLLAGVIKGFAIADLRVGFLAIFLLLVFYTLRFLPLHELNQLRASVGTAFLLIFAVRSERSRLEGAVFATLAVFFHYSSLVSVAFWLLGGVGIRRFFLVLSLGAAALVFMLDPVLQYVLSQLQVGVMYEALGLHFGKLNYFNPLVLLDIGMVVFMLLHWRRLPPASKRSLLVISFGIVAYYFAADSQAFAHRIREMTSVFWLLILAREMMRRGYRRNICVIFIGLSALGHLYSSFFGSRPLFL